jgi:hypothetical protein
MACIFMMPKEFHLALGCGERLKETPEPESVVKMAPIKLSRLFPQACSINISMNNNTIS